MPAEIIELAEGQQNDGDTAQQKNETDRGPQERAARRMISGERVIGKIIGVRMCRVRTLSDRGPGGPGEERGQIVKFLRIGNEIGRQAAVAFRLFEIGLPVLNLVGKRFCSRRQQSERIGSGVVTVGLQRARDLAVDDRAFRVRQCSIFFLEAVLGGAAGEIERPIVEHRRAEVRAQISAVTPDRAVVHQAVL